jgi:hypothetical protein
MTGVLPVVTLLLPATEVATASEANVLAADCPFA